MTKSARILQKVVVSYFYQVNAGFFLFGFFVLFGLPYSPVSFHLSLIHGIVKSQVFLGCVLLGWLLYNYKCVDYVLKQLNHTRQGFLFCLNALPKRTVYLQMLYVQILVYMPVLLYSVAIVWVAMEEHRYLCSVEVVLFNAGAVAGTAFLYVRGLQKRALLNSRFAFKSFSLPLSNPFFLYPLHFLWSERKQMLVVTKTFSLLLLYAFIKLYEPERYDIRPLELCLLLNVAAHGAIVYEIRAFEEMYLSFSRNLPLTIAGRFMRVMAMYTVLLLPELIFIFKGLNVHFAIYDYPQLLLLLLALTVLVHTVLFLETMKMEQFIRIVFGILAACFFILLYNPGLFLSVSMLVLAFVLYGSYYYDYER